MMSKRYIPCYEVFACIETGKYECYGGITGIPQSELAKMKYTETSKEIETEIKPVLIMGDKMASLFYNADTEVTYDTAEKERYHIPDWKKCGRQLSG